MKNSLPKILIILLIIILLGSTVLFAVLFFVKNGEVTNLQTQVNNLNSQLVQGGSQCDLECDEMREFRDEGLNITVEYHNSWEGILNTDIIDGSFVYDPYTGLVISNYVYTLTKGSAQLVFSKEFRAIDGFPSGLNEGETEYVVLNDEVVRYKPEGSTQWSYVTSVDCSEETSPEVDDLSGADVCIVAFFSGFGDTYASYATVNTDDPTLLTEADLIVSSTLN